MSQSEDMTAIYDYFNRTKAVTPEASTMKTKFIAWYNALGWYDRTMNSEKYADARAKRTAFNAANLTPEQPGGLTTEQMQMEPGPKTDEIIENQRTAERQKALATQTSSSLRRTIRRGSRGEDVKVWQNVLGIVADGIFGSGTEAKTKAWQKAHGLVADGIVGPKTWGEATADAKAKSVAAIKKASDLQSGKVQPKPKPRLTPSQVAVIQKREAKARAARKKAAAAKKRAIALKRAAAKKRSAAARRLAKRRAARARAAAKRAAAQAKKKQVVADAPIPKPSLVERFKKAPPEVKVASGLGAATGLYFVADMLMKKGAEKATGF